MKIELEWSREYLNDDGSYTEVMYDVVVEVTKGDPGCHTMKNGDPGWPASGPESEIIAIQLQPLKNCIDGIDLDPVLWPMLGFTLKERHRIEDEALEKASRQAEDDEAARADHEYDLRKDREE